MTSPAKSSALLTALLNTQALEVLLVRVEVGGEIQLTAIGPGSMDISNHILSPGTTVDILQMAPLSWWQRSTTLVNSVARGWLSVPANQVANTPVAEPIVSVSEVEFDLTLWRGQPAVPAASPFNKGRMYFDLTSEKLRISENGATFRNVVDPITVSGLTYATTVVLDFDVNLPIYRSLILTGNVAFTTTNVGLGCQMSLRLAAGGSPRNLSFPAGWKFLGGAAPSTLAAGKVAVLALTCYGNVDSDTVAGYAAEI
jgi:hypothetical protein